MLNFINSAPSSNSKRRLFANTLALEQIVAFFCLIWFLTSISTFPEVLILRSMVSLRIRRHFLKTFAPTYWTSENCLWKPNLEIEGKLKIKLDTHLPPELKVNVDNRLKVAAKWNKKGGICRFDIRWKQAGPVNGFIDFALNIGSHSTQKWKNNFLIHVFTSATTHVLWYSVRWASCYSSS